jgi:N-acetylglucosamine repressor
MNSKVTNIPLLRKKNVDTVLNVIWEKKITTRKELSRITSITIPTISNIICLLKEKNLIMIGEKGESTGGRNPELIEFNSSSYYVIGISLKVYKVRGFITDLFGKKVKEFVIDADYSGEHANILGQLNIVMEKLLDNFEGKEKILGIGVAFPGTIDSETGIVMDSPIIGNGIGVNIIDFIEGKFGYNTFVGNNANLCALNEYWFGQGINKKNILFIFAGYGIGSGMVINGEIYTGWRNAAGEIGHSVIKIDGERCYCGNYGCLETIASYPALFSEFVRRVKVGEKTKLRGIADKKFSIKLVNEIFESAKEGGELSSAIIKRIGRYLGVATANLINILNPEIIIIGGDYIKVKDIIEESIVETARLRAWHSSKDTEIVFTDFGLDACVYGASTIVIKNILDRGLDYIDGCMLKQMI